MYKWDKDRQTKLETVFFTLKIMVLFFCASPILVYFFKVEDVSAAFIVLNMKIGFVYLVIMILIIAMWFFVNKKTHVHKLKSYLEMISFYMLCVLALYFSGSYMSYYKFIFLFMIIIYTIEIGEKAGYLLSTISSVTNLTMDLLLYKNPGVNPYFQTDIILAATFFVIVWILGFYIKLGNEHIDDLKEMANRDGLTGMYNHSYIYDLLTCYFREDPEFMSPLSFIMLDIDYFKSYNDMYGHQKGDDVLVELSKILKKAVGSNGVVSRYGGEEFSIIYRGMGKDEALVNANIIRKLISDHNFDGEEFLPNKNLTVSIGIADRISRQDTPKDLINRADSALYRAKYLRKNRVEIYSTVTDRFPNIDMKNKDMMMSVKSLITIINSRDRYTYDHTERVVCFCEMFANYTGMSDEDKQKLLFSAYLHDIGKINVAKETLISDRPLTEEEWEAMKRHPVDGAEIVRQNNGTSEVADIVEQHHERYDGTGYPNKISGEKTHKLARILSIADSFDAMTAKRQYQKTKTDKEAFDELRRCAGKQFDPEYIEVFIQSIKENTQGGR